MSDKNFSSGRKFFSIYFHPTKNLNTELDEIHTRTMKKVWWVCNLGHEWSESPAKAFKRQGCIFCIGRKIWVGFNDIATTHPKAVQYWDYTKNGHMKPTEFSAGMMRKVWWVSPCGHEQFTAVHDYVRNISCSVCSGWSVLAGFNDLASQRPDVAKEWHPTKNQNLLPSEVSTKSSKKAWWICAKGHTWFALIGSRTTGHGCPRCRIKFLDSDPNILNQFHPSLNGNIDPYTVRVNSAEKLWWSCSKCQKTWQGSSYAVSTKKSQCPNCSPPESKIILGVNDLATVFPQLALQWSVERNNNKKFASMKKSDKEKFWWQCEKGHAWQARIIRRVKGSQCLVCRNKIDVEGVNDVASQHPSLIKEWDFDKNEDTSPNQLPINSSRKVWWLCPLNHSWEYRLDSRIKGKTCIVCSGAEVRAGVNDLGTTHPVLAEQWHPTKNNVLQPFDFTRKSILKVWWLGTCGHEWDSLIYDRVKGRGCFYCSNNKVLAGYNDLATADPSIAAQWHPTNNHPLTPAQVTSGSQKKVWWLGICGHEWVATVGGRKKYGCPYCAGNKVLAGFNDLAYKAPHLLEEWHPSKNGDETSYSVTSATHKKVWWLCVKNHEWEATVGSRYRGSDCPECKASSFVSKGEQELCDFVGSLGVKVVPSDRKVLGGGFEIDIWLPDQNIGVEFNGTYWHSEVSGKDSSYHHKKFLLAQKAEVKLIQVWEDDWLLRKNAVKQTLSQRLSIRNSFLQNPELVEIYAHDAKPFLENNHIEGFAGGSHYLGLQDSKKTLQAVLVLQENKDNVLHVVRYATLGAVVGDFTELLNQAEKLYHPNAFTAVADNCLFDGELYENNGFINVGELPPDYMYVVSNERKHKSGYSVNVFRDDPTLLWEEGLTESELALLNSIPRIWDAGRTEYRLDVTSPA